MVETPAELVPAPPLLPAFWSGRFMSQIDSGDQPPSWMLLGNLRWSTQIPNRTDTWLLRGTFAVALLAYLIGSFVAMPDVPIEILPIAAALLSSAVGINARGRRLERGLVAPEVVYLRKYDNERGVSSRKTSLMHLCYLSIIPTAGFVSIQIPPRTDREHFGDKLGLTVTSGPFAVRTRDDADWQSSAKYLLGQAKCVLVEGHGWSRSLEWEIRTTLMIAEPGKIIIVADAKCEAIASEVQKSIAELAESVGTCIIPSVLLRRSVFDGEFDRALEQRIQENAGHPSPLRVAQFSSVWRWKALAGAVYAALFALLAWFVVALVG